MSKNILFRSDSSSTIGTGHIMRDLVLANQYPNSKIFFATQNLEGNLNSKIVESGYELVNLSSNTIDELDRLIKKLNIDLLIIDHYEINYEDEKQLKTNNPNLKILSFDDTYEKHYCDILLNHNISADESKYKDLVPKDCELRCGIRYTLLRQEFKDINKSKRVKSKSKKKIIFLSMGGSDLFNFNYKILRILKLYHHKIEVYLATTTANQNLPQLKRFVFKNRWTKLYINASNLAEIMYRSDFAIITPSVTVNEVMYLKLPFISLKVIDNQEEIHRYLKRKKFAATESLAELTRYARKWIK